MLTERVVAVSADPVVELFIACSPGPADRSLLVIHGGPDWDHTYLREPLIRLAGRHRLLLPDLRGCGRSTKGLGAERYTPDAVIGDLIALLDALGIEQVAVLGFSYGGLLAQRLVLAAPERVRALIIASSSVVPVPSQPAGDRSRRQMPGTKATVWSDPSACGPELTRAAAIAAARANIWRPQSLRDYIRRLDAVQFSAEWLRAQRTGNLPSARPYGALERLADLEIPILLLHGRHDTIFPASLVEPTRAAIPSAQAVILEAAGHMAHIDQPCEWLTAISRFLP